MSGAPRFVRKDARPHHDAHCKLCGACYGINVAGGQQACGTTTCLACESTQCMVNGLGRGQCGICHVGLLPGWSGTDCQCSYAGCTARAVARADGPNRNRCRAHLERGKWLGYVAARLVERDRLFVWKGLES